MVKRIPSASQATTSQAQPPSGSSRWVTSQAIASAATQVPTRVNDSSDVGLPRPGRGCCGGASGSMTGRKVAPVRSGAWVVITRPFRRRSDCG
jgi:hypothetical protein